jgi:hypothetical protein
MARTMLFARALIPLAVAAALAAPADAAEVRIRPLVDLGTGAPVETRLELTLVDPDGRPIQAARSTDGAPVASRYSTTLAADADPLLLDLTPQSEIGTPDGALTYYLVRLQAAGIRQPWLIQVPATDGPHELADLAEAAQLIAGSSLLADRLLPPCGTDGQFTAWDQTAGAWTCVSVPPGSGIPDAPTDGEQYARQDGAWAVVEVAGGADPACADITDSTAAGCAVVTAADAAAQRSALGLGSAATTAATDYATAAQGALADSATQPGDLAAVATSGSYADLLNAPDLSGIGDAVTLRGVDLDAAVGTPSDGDLLVYRAAGADWVLEAKPAGGSNPACADITDGTTAGCAVVTAADAAAQRSALGLGTAATTAATDYATAAQGALADSATQPGDLAAVATSGAYADLSGLPALGTAAATDAADYATAAQGALADSATQPGDLATVATSGAYADLSGTPTLGTAAATAATDYATAAQGALADSAVQPGDLAPAKHYIQLPLTPVGGTLSAGDVLPAWVPAAGTITGVDLACGVAPTISAATADVVRAAAWADTATAATVLSADVSLGAGSYETTGTVSSGAVTAGDYLAAIVETADAGGTAADCILTVTIAE